MRDITLSYDGIVLGNVSYSRIPVKDDFLMFEGAAYIVNKVILIEGSTETSGALVVIEPCQTEGIDYLN